MKLALLALAVLASPEIDKTNVQSLKVAWTFRTGDIYVPAHGKPAAFEDTPLYLDGTLYVATPLGRVIALDPVTGKQRWAFDARVPRDKGYGDFATRGLAAWRSRLYLATVDARLIAIDAASGERISSFGQSGTVNLRTGLRIPAAHFADYEETSPPAVIGETIVVGSAIADNRSVSQPSGEVRGFDTLTGKLKWTWDPLHGKIGAGNAWAAITVDPALNLVFVPTGSASPDFYGGERPGDNAYANSVVALKADTGELVWHFQTVHHDLWDYDVATSPLLYDIGARPVIAIGSKTGNIFILDRGTGTPVFGVEERAVPKSDVPGETAALTQPFPIKPAPVTPQGMTATQAWGISKSDRKWCRAEIATLRTGPIFTPPSLRGTLMLPGSLGGLNWGGFAYDAKHDLLVMPSNHLASVVRLLKREDYGQAQAGDWEFAPQEGTPYGVMRRFLLSPKHSPCTPPPWSTLIAIRGSTGEKQWESPLGKLLSLGGPITTAGGLVFVAGTIDPAIYAFDVETGKQVWRGDLPTSARATPVSYRGPDGRQYVVICAGSHQPGGDQPLGDFVVAFSL